MDTCITTHTETGAVLTSSNKEVVTYEVQTRRVGPGVNGAPFSPSSMLAAWWVHGVAEDHDTAVRETARLNARGGQSGDLLVGHEFRAVCHRRLVVSSSVVLA